MKSSRRFYQHMGIKLYALLALGLLFSSCAQTATSPTPETHPAEQVLHQYYTALQTRDYAAAAALLVHHAHSPTSTDAEQMWTKMDEQGWRLLDYTIQNGLSYGESRALFNVTITQSGQTPEVYETSDVLWWQEGEWRYAGGLLDALEIRNQPQTHAGVTVAPGLLFQYVSGSVFLITIENATPRPVIWGTLAETPCATLNFSQTVVTLDCATMGQRRLAPNQKQNLELVFPINVRYFGSGTYPTILELGGFRQDIEEASGDESWGYRFKLEYGAASNDQP
ncbi:MAG: hypothetical protein RBT75_15820 [Anaerolineae bacterium]|jgi:hypothetical protein|nr:hypothetical protein [Anaerolineae bacterium]